MNVELVIGEVTGEIVGETLTAIVVGGSSLDRETGARVDRPETIQPVVAITELLDGGTRVALIDGLLARVHADWTEHVERLPAGAQLVATTTLALAVVPEGSRLTARILDAGGMVQTLTLPSWLADARVISLATARAIVFVTPSQVVWLRYETLAELHAKASRMQPSALVRFTTPNQPGDGFVTVTRGGAHNAVVEGENGQRIFLTTQCAPVTKGDRLEIRFTDGSYALFDGKRMVAQQDSISLVRTATSSPTSHETFVTFTASPGAVARSKLAPGVAPRLERLRALGFAPNLDLDATLAATFGRSQPAPTQTAIAAALVLYVHYRSFPPDEARVLLSRDAIARASRANTTATSARWYLLMMDDYQPFALWLDEQEHAAIVDGDLLVLEPVPPFVEPPASAETARAQLLDLIKAAPEDVVLEPREAGFALRLTIRGAALLDQLAEHSRG